MINLWVLLFAVGVFPTLELSSEDVNSLSASDVDVLRDEFGATEALFDALRDAARAPGRVLRINFATQTFVDVTAELR